MIAPDVVLARLQDERRDVTDLLESLTRDFAGMVEASADSNADDEHDPEGATIAFERSQLRTTIEQATRRRSEIDAAEARLAEGTYGTCEVCGTSIPDARLEARPTARACIDHA